MTDTQTFSADVYAQRLHAAQKAAADKGIDLLLIGTGPDFAYLTGSWVSSHERLTVLVVPQQGNAWIAAPNTDITDIKAAPVGELDVELRGWNDGENPYELALRGAGDGLGKVALGQSLTADHVLRFQDLLPHASYELATYALAELFTRKDEAEIAELRKAGHAIDAVHAKFHSFCRPVVLRPRSPTNWKSSSCRSTLLSISSSSARARMAPTRTIAFRIASWLRASQSSSISEALCLPATTPIAPAPT